jgi:hypothetical protein
MHVTSKLAFEMSIRGEPCLFLVYMLLSLDKDQLNLALR